MVDPEQSVVAATWPGSELRTLSLKYTSYRVIPRVAGMLPMRLWRHRASGVRGVMSGGGGTVENGLLEVTSMTLYIKIHKGSRNYGYCDLCPLWPGATRCSACLASLHAMELIRFIK